MSRLISRSRFIQEAMRAGLRLLLVSLAVAAHTAQSEEGSFALRKDIVSIKSVSSDPYRLPSYRLNANVGPNRSKDAAPTGAGFSSAPRLLLVAEPQKEDDWSINIQKQIPTSSDCSHLSSHPCFDPNDEGPDNKPRHDSFWLVLRKTFHF